MHDGAYLEFERIISILRNDPSTRRAVIQFFNQDDLSDKKDVPCYNHLQFFLRNGLLHCHVVMRSQSALMVLPYDFYLFSMLHEVFAVRLSVKLGRLYYTCNSIHIYEDEMELAKSIEIDKNTHFQSLEMKEFGNETLENLKQFFLDLSKYYSNSLNMQNPLAKLENYNLDTYWRKTIESCF